MLSNYFINQSKKVLDIVLNYFKYKEKEIPEILSNH